MSSQFANRIYICKCPENQWCVMVLLKTLEELESGHFFKITLRNALYSITNHPAKIDCSNPTECQKIKYIGPRIASILQERNEYGYQEYIEQGNQYRERYISQSVAQPLPPPNPSRSSRSTRSTTTDETKEYIPRINSGNWCILYSLSLAMDDEYKQRSEDNGDPIEFTKERIISLSQPYCDYSYTVPNQTGYTAWSSKQKLIDHGYMTQNGYNQSAKYKLTPKGYRLGKEFVAKQNENDDIENIPPSSSIASPVRNRKRNRNDTDDTEPLNEIDVDNYSSPPSNKRQRQNNHNSSPRTSSLSKVGSNYMSIIDKFHEEYDLTKPIHINGKNYKLYLNVDPREKSKKTKRIDIYEDLKDDDDDDLTEDIKIKIPVTNITLSCGDFVWLLINIDDKDNEDEKLLLPFIIERKTWSDLSKSMKTGRYQQQKHVISFVAEEDTIIVGGRKIYLLEARYDEMVQRSMIEQCFQAVIDTECRDGFQIYKTKSKRDTIKILVNLTYMIRHWIEGNYILGMDGMEMDHQSNNNMFNIERLTTLNVFNQFKKNNLIDTMDERIKTMELLMKIPDCTEKDAFYITSKFSTIKDLLNAYDKCIEKRNKMIEEEKHDEKDENINKEWNCPKIGCDRLNKSIYKFCPKCGTQCIKSKSKKKKKKKEKNKYDPSLLIHRSVSVYAEWKYKTELMRKRLCGTNKPDADIEHCLFTLRNQNGNDERKQISKALSKKIWETFGSVDVVQYEYVSESE